MRTKRPVRPSGVVVWRGESLLTGGLISVIVTGLPPHFSQNDGTGPMLQAWGLPDEGLPRERQADVCGDCALTQLCYVEPHRAPLKVWKKDDAGGYPEDFDSPAPFVGQRIRLGAWGDPASWPTELTKRLIEGTVMHTGYTQQWKTCDQELRQYLMASVHSPAQKKQANDMGWSTYRDKKRGHPMLPDEIACPKGELGGYTKQCYDCGLCCGAQADEFNIVENIHGYRAPKGQRS